MKEEMIRDCLVVGIRDSALSQKLQLDDKLALKTAKTSIRQKEAVHKQQQTLKGADGSTSNSSNVEVVANRKARVSHTHRKSRNPAQGKPKAGEKCGRCGRERHPRAKCPAKDAQCHSCGRKGHYSSMCHHKAVSTVTTGR